MSDATVRGRFVWHELLTVDPKSAATFFTNVIGWKAQPWGDDGSYSLFVSGTRQLAGLMELPDEARKMGAPSHWLTYVGTPNVDDTAKLAASLGAKVHKAPEDIPTVGRFAVIEDPQGAYIGLYTPNQGSRSDAEPPVGDFSWHELATTDVAGAFAFYQKLFGWEETSAMDMGPDLGTYHMFGRAKTGPVLGGMFNKPPQMPGPAFWLPYIRVSDVKKTVATVKKRGGQVINGPMEVPGGDWIAQGLDLQGAMFAMHTVTATAAAHPAAPQKKAIVKKSPAKKSAAKKSAVKKGAVKKSAVKKAVAKKKSAVRKAAPKKSAARKSAGRNRPIVRKRAAASTRSKAKKKAKKR